LIRQTNNLIRITLEPKLLKMLLSMNSGGYLKDIGWIESFKNQLPMDKEENPLPWVTYSFIDFISDRLTNEMNIFEYGSGNSTLWYAQRVNSVTSVEHDKEWFEKIKNSMPENVNINYQKLIKNEKYSHFTSQSSEKFDIVIVDGRDRVNCILNSINSLNNNGVIVLDDSEREYYLKGIKFLLTNGFKKIDFWGISPGLFYKKCTTIFYKEDNCLGI